LLDVMNRTDGAYLPRLIVQGRTIGIARDDARNPAALLTKKIESRVTVRLSENHEVAESGWGLDA
jgi:hypothetical protein